MLFLLELIRFTFRLFFEGELMENNDTEVAEKQLKNIRRKLAAFIWEASAKRVIELCLFAGIHVPKNLIDKFVSKDFDIES